MRFLVSFNYNIVKKVYGVDYLRSFENIPIELDLTNLINSELMNKFIPLLASEIEEYGLNIQYVRVTPNILNVNNKDLIDRLLYLIDYLNVNHVVMTPPNTIDEVIEVMDQAIDHGIRVVWLLDKGKHIFKSVNDIYEISNYVSPLKLRLAMSIVNLKSLREFIKKFLYISGFLKIIYCSNKSRVESGLSIFSNEGKIDYLKIMKVLSMLKYEDDVVLRYKFKYYNYYQHDYNFLTSYVSAISSKIIDDKLKKAIDSIVNEIIEKGFS